MVVGRRRLLEDCGLGGDAPDAIDAEIEQEMTQIMERALAAPYPDPALPATAYKSLDELVSKWPGSLERVEL